MKCFDIDYKGKTYKYQQVNHKSVGNVLIASEELEKALMPDGKFDSPYAQRLDEKFFGYVNDDMFNLTKSEFTEKVNQIFK